MSEQRVDTPQVAVIGGGVAGATNALYLGQTGLNVTLFEREASLISGPPFCHLHAGGNLYREISDKQCVTLLRQSIDFLRYYPFCVDYRPTVIAIPIEDSGTPEQLLPRLSLLTDAYKKLIAEDANNQVLGRSEEYYRVYTREQVESIRELPVVKVPKSFDEWMIPVAKNIDLEKIQFPLIMVQEYGLNLFRLSAGITLEIEQLNNVELLTETTVTGIDRTSDKKRWIVTYTYEGRTTEREFDYLINAAGFRTGKIDDMVGVECKSMVEFKAAYVSRWEGCCETLWPEVIFHGERGTPRGMGQFTPYPGGYFQLHGMTKEITLYEGGLSANTALSCQPKLKQNFIEKIERSWETKEVQERTQSAIHHLAKFIPDFSAAKVGSKPLFGAQQIPGDDPTLRVAEVSFPAQGYARCEIVKASSVLSMADEITKQLISRGYVDESMYGKREFAAMRKLDEMQISTSAKTLCDERDYPISLSRRSISHI
ncbi:MAG: FAD-dependent oxidoreductase [Campylobacterota bacterium]